ncbi:hypothetical protein ACG2F4_05065 [Halalkalibaculum sp. DA3122]|uniref:hypothetical protein n=1 Tax=Halalkalibaculum sp. DA3122 TaxID=3373607 RepID=UPI003755300C
MNKREIKSKVKKAYSEAAKYPNFLENFKPRIQEVIDSYMPSTTTNFWHVDKDIDYMSHVSKSMNYNTRQYLNLVTNYISLLVEAYEKGSRNIDVKKLFQTDIFDEE